MGIRYVGVSVAVVVIPMTRYVIGPIALGVVVFVVPQNIPGRQVVLRGQMMIELERLLSRPALVDNVCLKVVGVSKDVGGRSVGQRVEGQYVLGYRIEALRRQNAPGEWVINEPTAGRIRTRRGWVEDWNG